MPCLNYHIKNENKKPNESELEWLLNYKRMCNEAQLIPRWDFWGKNSEQSKNEINAPLSAKDIKVY